jgi:excisionase family DNA binding protein
MGRNKKPRRVAHRPPVTVFKPAGVPARALQWLRLTLDAYEALRLADYEGLSHEEAAERLGVSRPTVSRMLEDARRTVARALVEGQAVAIEGGPVQWIPGPRPGGRGRGPAGRGRHGWGWARRGG